MILKGTVRNVIDFGAFRGYRCASGRTGTHFTDDCDRFIKHPLEAVSVGDIVDVQVVSVDVVKKRIALTMKIQDQNLSAEKQNKNAQKKRK